MRIGILTLPLHINYGGILQAYALQTALERMGHEVFLIEKKLSLFPPLWKIPLVYGKRILKNLAGHSFPVFYEWKYKKELSILAQHTNRFVDAHIKRANYKEYSDIKETDFDVIIVGSDQIWRPRYFPQIYHAYLDFTKGWNIKRIAYAASFGTDVWEYSLKQTENCRLLLQKFDAVSVRELSGIKSCQKKFGIIPVHVLDPTMLLAKEDYIRLFESANIPKSTGNLLNYILDETPEKDLFLKKIAMKNGLIPFRVNSQVGNNNLSYRERIQPPVEQWLRGFYDADYVITDSFHACVFSILFQKPFLAIGNTGRGLSRFESLLDMFELRDCLVTDISTYVYESKTIDWSVVTKKLKNLRRLSENFLLTSIV